MLEKETINTRLKEMRDHPDPSNKRWPENCEGSRKALVIFVGSSPGGTKEEHREDIKLADKKPYWNQSYNKPLSWSHGFKKSFKKLVETIFELEYEQAAKLIARLNLDWIQNPESDDVPYRYMWKGCTAVLPVIFECNPDVIIPMDQNSFNILEIVLFENNFSITSLDYGEIKVPISSISEKESFHRDIKAFFAKRGDNQYLVIKSLQHPARIYDEEYAERIGKALRQAILQV